MTDPADAGMRRMCVFDLWLTCGHIATVAIEGWYPVTVACCERLGGTIHRGQYVAYAAQVDYATLLSETYAVAPPGPPPAPTRVLRRRSRTDDPSPPGPGCAEGSAGRYPARVGAAWNLDDPRSDPPPP
jgi:hypothetical protein